MRESVGRTIARVCIPSPLRTRLRDVVRRRRPGGRKANVLPLPRGGKAPGEIDLPSGTSPGEAEDRADRLELRTNEHLPHGGLDDAAGDRLRELRQSLRVDDVAAVACRGDGAE